MANPIEIALKRLADAVAPTVKGVFLQEGPDKLAVFYNEHLQSTTSPDRTAKSGRRYYSRPNTTNELRTLYGNIQRALTPDARNKGNITDVTVSGDQVVFISGIDTDARVQAGPDTTTLEYAEFHEKGTSRYRARPFLGPGFEDFVKQGVPQLIDEVGERLEDIYNG